MMHYIMVAGDHVAPSAVAAPPHQPLMARSLLLLLVLGLHGLRGSPRPRAVGRTVGSIRLGGGSTAGSLMAFKAERCAAGDVHR
jgi:hypothetical protein